MTIRLSHWYGRLGNNIQQCALGTMMAHDSDDTFETIDHEIIKKHKTTFGSSGREIVSKCFYWEGPYREVLLPAGFIYRSMRTVCQKYILPNLEVPKRDIPDDTLVIHIRSGDIFDKGVTNPEQYAPNPLRFYTPLVEEFKKTIVVTEPDRFNPVVEELERYPQVTVQSLTVAEDFATMLGAKNLCSSGVGTFAVAAALCSKNIKNFFCSNLSISEHLNWHMLQATDVQLHQMHLYNYLKPGEWKNTDEQRRFILDYKPPIS